VSVGKGEADKKQGAAIIEGLRLLVPKSDTGEKNKMEVPPVPNAEPPKESYQKTWRIRFQPNKEILLTGSNPLNLINELRDLGNCKFVAHFDQIPTLDTLVSERCYLYWDIVLTTSRGK
jgi:two-component system chemotaxis sensor kinase CheA